VIDTCACGRPLKGVAHERERCAQIVEERLRYLRLGAEDGMLRVSTVMRELQRCLDEIRRYGAM